ncbi:MAG: efflux RND transporter periplasmic adaptor subunit [Desulfobacteraceae bacterium]|nr:efflux RND transporter periplasmic adaptor subunit [Desulfobacteraceae bacterium]
MSSQEREVSKIGLLMKIIIPICLIAIGVAGWSYFNSKESKMKRKPHKRQAPFVEAITVKPGSYQSWVYVMGTVIPDKEIILKSKVSGEVTFTSPDFVQGGIMEKGETLLEIDDSDYKIDIQKAKTVLDKALSDFAIEKGSQMIAKEELKLINMASQDEIKTTDLALRKPQLIKAQAMVDSARADLDKAQLNLSRTKVNLPFNALILEKHVNTGSLVNTQGSLAVLVGVDTYNIEAQVPLDRLAALDTNQASGSDAIIQSQYSNQTWQGKLARTTGKMTDKSRMAGVIISVPDPFGMKNQGEEGRKNSKLQLLLNDHVTVKIAGEILKNVFSIQRSILRDGNTLWIYDSGVLRIKEVKLVWKEDGVVYIKSGISQGDMVITSNLPAAVDGMALQLSSGDQI